MKDGSLVNAKDFEAGMKDDAEFIVVNFGVSCFKIRLKAEDGIYCFDEAQKAAKKHGKGWRCPTRHEWLDLYDARFNGFDELAKMLDADIPFGWYWTCEEDANPQYSASTAWDCNFTHTSCLTYSNYYKSNLNRVVAVSAYRP